MDNHNGSSHLTHVIIHLDRLSHNMRLLQQQVGDRPLWPAIKANAYGHGAEIVARHLVDLGYDTLCVAHVFEAAALLEAGIEATFIILSATLPEHAEAIVAHGCEPAICTMDMAEALARAAERDGRCIPVHLKIDTGMGRIGIRPDEAAAFLDRCRQLPGLTVRGIMSHFPRADESDKGYSLEQIKRFRQVLNMTRGYGIEVRHMANSAAILDLPGSYFDAARPGIAIYGLRPSAEVRSPLCPAIAAGTRMEKPDHLPQGGSGGHGAELWPCLPHRERLADRHGPHRLRRWSEPQAFREYRHARTRQAMQAGGTDHDGSESSRRDEATPAGRTGGRGGPDRPAGRTGDYGRRACRHVRDHQL